MKCQHSCPHLASKRAVLYGVTKEVNWPAARNSSHPCSGTTTIKWSLRGQTHRHKMVESRDLIKLLEPLLVVYYTAPLYPLSFGRSQWSTQSTSTTGWSTAELNAHRMRPLQVNNQK
jgi:hypothetical protein